MGTANNMHRQYYFNITVCALVNAMTSDQPLDLYNNYLSYSSTIQDAVKPGQNIIAIDFEVTKQRLSFISMFTFFLIFLCSRLQTTPIGELLSIPTQSTVTRISTIPSDALSERHNQTLAGIGHLLLFQLAYGKTSGK